MDVGTTRKESLKSEKEYMKHQERGILFKNKPEEGNRKSGKVSEKDRYLC